MGLFDSVTSFFTGSTDDSSGDSGDSTSSDASVAAGATSGTNTSTMLSNHFSLGDLVVTTQSLNAPNLPSTQEQMNNLTTLAQVLDTLTDNIGPFQILSAFRTAELQQALGEGGNPVSPGTSFHEVGRGIDIYPTGMTINAFTGQILANNAYRSLFAEIIPKPPQNSIHLGINVPGDTRNPKILTLSSAGSYIPMEDDQIEQLVQPYLTDVTNLDDTVQTIQAGMTPSPLVPFAAAAAVIYYFFIRK